MANLLHTKGSRNRILNSLPTNTFGDDGDIVFCSIKGKGIFLCAKVNGRWSVADKMQDLTRMGKTSIRDLSVDKLNIKDSSISNAVSDLTISSNSNITLDARGDIELDADGGQVRIKDAGSSQFLFDCDSTSLKIYDDTDSADWFTITVGASGATTIATVDDGAAVGHLTLDPDGDLLISGADIKIDATKKIYLDGGGDTYIHESSADVIQLYTGGDKVLEVTEATTGNVADFGTTGVGFTQFEPTYNSSDTNVNFNDNGNKAFVTFGSGNITDMNLYFPNVSCNCVLLLKQDGSGSRTVTNWKTFDQADGNESTVVWAGGSAPTLTTTANKLDIISLYWDNDNHKAYGVASLNF